MTIFDSTALHKNIEATTQHLQQAGSALIDTLSSSLKLAKNTIAIGASVVEAVQLGYNDYTYALSKITSNIPIVSIGICAVSLLCTPLAYGTFASVAAHPFSYLTCSFAVPVMYNFFTQTDGVKNIQDTIGSAGDVLSNGGQVVKALCNACDSAINTVGSALASYLIRPSDHVSKETNDEAVNIDEYDITSTADIYDAEVALSGTVAVA